MTPFLLPVANGATIVPLQSGSAGAFEITLRCLTPPSAGALLIEGLPFNSATYTNIGGATAIALTGLAGGVTLNAGDFGHFAALRFTLSGVTGGSGNIAGAAGPVTPTGLPSGVANGLRALNVQSYNESNAKLGTAFYVQYQLPPLAATTGINKIWFQTGAQKVIVKSRDFYGYGASLGIQVYKQPTGVSGGSPIIVQNYNDINPVATTVSVTGNVTATGNGTAWGDPQHIYGAQTAGNRAGQTLPPGGERVLKPNSSYLVVVTNTDNAIAQADYFLSWFEGNPDLPRT